MKVLIKTFGCSANQNDSEIMAGLLQDKGHTIVSDINRCDAVIVNTCIVKGKTETRVRNYLRKIRNSCKRIVVAGCMPLVMKEEIEKIAPNASIIGYNDVKKIIKAISNKKFVSISNNKTTKPCSKKIRKNPIINITQISSGCNGSCSYCIVKLVKKGLFCFPPDRIIKDVEEAVKDGCREIWLTSQDNASYNHNGVKLPQLLQQITRINGDFYVRIGMMNPDSVKKIIKPLIKVYKNHKIFKFLHIPVQSGNDEILKAMNRKYTVADFRNIVSNLKRQIPDITISTDIIVGFPGETTEQFNDSLKLIRELRPDSLNISRFWARPGTKAAKMKNKLNGNITKERSQKLTKLFNKVALENNKQKWLGWSGKVLVDELGKDAFIGRNFAYKPIAVKGKFSLGAEAKIRIRDATEHYLIAEVMK